MKCPFCNQDNTRVVDSRPVEDTNSIRRRRLCDACGRRFTTYEKGGKYSAYCDQKKIRTENSIIAVKFSREF